MLQELSITTSKHIPTGKATSLVAAFEKVQSMVSDAQLYLAGAGA